MSWYLKKITIFILPKNQSSIFGLINENKMADSETSKSSNWNRNETETPDLIFVDKQNGLEPFEKI